MQQRRALILIDLVAGLTIVGIILVALSVAATNARQLGDRLAESRAAAAALEGAISQLQRGDMPTAPPDARLTVRQADARPVGRRVWVEVTLEQGRRRDSLSGLVPSSALAQWKRTVAPPEGAEGRP